MARDKRVSSKGEIGDFLTGSGLLNLDKDEYNQLAFDDHQALQTLLDQYANDPTSLEGELKARGMLTADGVPDVRKMIDTGYLQSVKEGANEASNLGAQTSLRSARLASLSKGTPGASTAYTGALAKSISDMARGNAKNYTDAYKGEKETAYNKTVGWGQQALSDKRYSRGDNMRARQNQAQTSSDNAGAQTDGIINAGNLLNLGTSLLTGGGSSAVGAGIDFLGELIGTKKRIKTGQGKNGRADTYQSVPYANAYDKGNGEWGV